MWCEPWLTDRSHHVEGGPPGPGSHHQRDTATTAERLVPPTRDGVGRRSMATLFLFEADLLLTFLLPDNMYRGDVYMLVQNNTFWLTGSDSITINPTFNLLTPQRLSHSYSIVQLQQMLENISHIMDGVSLVLLSWILLLNPAADISVVFLNWQFISF